MNQFTKCLVVDDEPLALKLIIKHIDQIPQLELVAACQNALEAFEVLKKEPIDLIFLDIQMPVLTGIEFIKSLQNPPSIIFTTAYRDYAVESYELNVIDYLLKPIAFTRFFKAVNKFLDKQESVTMVEKVTAVDKTVDNYLYVNVNKKHVKVLFDEILYVESIKDYVRIHTAKQSIVTKDTLADFEQKLPNSFFRIHRSYIVNKVKITAFTAHDIEINEREIPIGVSYKRSVMKWLK